MSSVDDFLPLRAVLLQSTFIELALNGLYGGLFFVTVYALMFKQGTYHRINWGLFLALTAMYLLSTIHVINEATHIKGAFVDHGDSPASTLEYILQPPLFHTLLGAIALTTNTLISDCVLIWRCWTIWNHDWRIVVLPLASTLVGTALGFRSIAEQAAYVLNPNLDPNAYIDFATPYFGLNLATTAVATLLIIARIIKMTEKSTRQTRGYWRIIEMVVESAAIYLVALIVFLPLQVQGAFNSAYPQVVVAQMVGMAPTLLVARVAFGLARPDRTWQGESAPIAFRGYGGSASEQPSTIVLSSRSRSDFSATKPDGIHV
ncbi:hypothetical protein GGX14DRAFT_404248 [Mycena pura]|uniref:Uncharacterized protein n=1 Tax=Mycena pura TaxID=153505 RepID=A0AAD6UUS0_9AGAR|nr:hypothetical protein GGX14DRAFT_404248 [Mycena pura]